jgi:putative aldouronate transport system permease protein
LPIIATIALWSAVGLWNEYFYGMILIRSPSKLVLQVLLRRVLLEVQGASDASQLFDNPAFIPEVTVKSVRAALLFVTTLPILVVYPFVQKYFVRGLTAGAVKG